MYSPHHVLSLSQIPRKLKSPDIGSAGEAIQLIVNACDPAVESGAAAARTMQVTLRHARYILLVQRGFVDVIVVATSECGR